jgi:hypothetical protein
MLLFATLLIKVLLFCPVVCAAIFIYRALPVVLAPKGNNPFSKRGAAAATQIVYRRPVFNRVYVVGKQQWKQCRKQETFNTVYNTVTCFYSPASSKNNLKIAVKKSIKAGKQNAKQIFAYLFGFSCSWLRFGFAFTIKVAHRCSRELSFLSGIGIFQQIKYLLGLYSPPFVGKIYPSKHLW